MAELTHKPQLRTDDDEYMMSLAGFVVSLSGHGIVGLILSAIALNKSHHAGRKNTFALVGLIVGISLTALSIIMILLYILVFSSSFFLSSGRYY